MSRFAIICVGVVMSSAHAQAQSADAEAMFSEGDKLMAAGQVAQACDTFEASNKIEPRAGTLIRLGQCREQTNQLASAWAAYKDALTRVKDPRKRQLAQNKVAEIEPKLSYLTISVPDESRIDNLELARNGTVIAPQMWNRAVPVDGGSYTIVGRAPGHVEWQTHVNVPSESGKVTVDIPKFKELGKLIPNPSKAVATTSVATASPPEDDRDEVERPSSMTGRRKLAIGIAAGGIGVAVVGVLLGTQATSRTDHAASLCPDPQVPCGAAAEANASLDAAHTRALGANIAFGVGAVAGITAGVLWFTGAPSNRSRHVAISPALGHEAASVLVTARF